MTGGIRRWQWGVLPQSGGFLGGLGGGQDQWGLSFSRARRWTSLQWNFLTSKVVAGATGGQTCPDNLLTGPRARPRPEAVPVLFCVVALALRPPRSMWELPSGPALPSRSLPHLTLPYQPRNLSTLSRGPLLLPPASPDLYAHYRPDRPTTPTRSRRIRRCLPWINDTPIKADANSRLATQATTAQPRT